jgi:hypothetical protein
LSELKASQNSFPELFLGLSRETLDRVHPENVLGVTVSSRQFLISLYGHLNYHLGQIDYLRRILTKAKAIEFAGL